MVSNLVEAEYSRIALSNEHFRTTIFEDMYITANDTIQYLIRKLVNFFIKIQPYAQSS